MSICTKWGDDVLKILSQRDGLDELTPTTDLIVGAHPDDVELIGLTSIGDPAVSVTAVVCTDGGGSLTAAGDDPPVRRRVVELRREEQAAAAKEGGYAQLVMLEFTSD